MQFLHVFKMFEVHDHSQVRKIVSMPMHYPISGMHKSGIPCLPIAFQIRKPMAEDELEQHRHDSIGS